MTGGERDGGEDRLADSGSLRRIERMAIGWTVVGTAVIAWTAPFQGGQPSALAAASVLTGVSAASIVAFRGLQRIVSTLGPADQDTRKQRTIGWRQGLAALVRLCLLGALVIGGSLRLGQQYAPALVLGFSTLPAALMTEGLLQVVRALRGKDPDGFS